MLDKEASEDTRAALASAQKNSFIILLKHQPVVDSGIPFDLQLSGHIHGGQIFPFGLLTQLVYGVRTGLTKLRWAPAVCQPRRWHLGPAHMPFRRARDHAGHDRKRKVIIPDTPRRQ